MKTKTHLWPFLTGIFLTGSLVQCSSTRPQKIDPPQEMVVEKATEKPAEANQTSAKQEEQQPLPPEVVRTDRLLTENHTSTANRGTSEDKNEDGVERLWKKEQQCDASLPACLTACRAAKTLRMATLHFAIGENDCDLECRNREQCSQSAPESR